MRDIQLDINAVHDAARKAAERREKAELATIELNERTKEQNRILEEQNRQLKETNLQLLLRLGGPVMSDREKLLHLIDEAEELAKKRVDASNPQFCAWRTNVERLLIKTFGEQECAKFDCAFEPNGVVMCDTLALARCFRPDLKSHALGNLLEPLGVDGVNSHDALDDVMACAGVFFKLLSEKRSVL